jgi:hypothetical protein
MMQYVKCDKFSSFAPKQGKKIPSIFEMQNINSFLYETKTKKNTKITNNIVPFHSTKMNNVQNCHRDGHYWTLGSLKLVLIIIVIGILILLYGMDLKRHGNEHFHVNF